MARARSIFLSAGGGSNLDIGLAPDLCLVTAGRRRDAERMVRLADRPAEFRDKEYQLQYEQLVNAGEVLTRDELLGRIAGAKGLSDLRALRIGLRRFRSRLGEDASTPPTSLASRESATGWRRGGRGDGGTGSPEAAARIDGGQGCGGDSRENDWRMRESLLNPLSGSR